MKYTTICGDRLSRVGLGSPRPLRHGANDDAYDDLINAALDVGVNFFDVAPAYGTEHNLGSFAPRRKEIFLSTKTPHRLSLRRGWKTVPDRITKSLEQSLINLRTDCIDYYFMHAISPGIYHRAMEVVLPTLLKFKKEGKIRHIGISEDVPHDKYHRMILTAALNPDIDILMCSAPPVGLAAVAKPLVGMLVNGPITMEHQKRFFDVTLTGTSSIEHLRQNCSE